MTETQPIVSKTGEESETRVFSLNFPTRELYKRDNAEAFLTVLMKEDEGPEDGRKRISKQGVHVGRVPHPFDIEAVTKFQTANVHHSRCILAKKSATVGLGFMTEEEKIRKKQMMTAMMGAMVQGAVTQSNQPVSDFELSKADETLNPLCDHSWRDTLNDVAEDYFQVGNGYLEVVRKGGKITGLFHIPAAEVFIWLEDALYNKHFEVINPDGGPSRRFAVFGDRDDFLSRAKASDAGFALETDITEDMVSEVIHFRQPTSLSRWYGFPDWLACTASIELVQMLLQYKFDFFNNRGVPEFLLFVMGKKLDEADWTKITNSLKANVGQGNSHKSAALNLTDPEIKVELHKLAMEGKQQDEFSDTKENLALDIVSAHGVPPLLAGIQIPGRLGATNELPNALMAFQTLVIGQAQEIFQQTLGNTLGDKAKSNLGLTIQDFVFRTILDRIDVGTMDTIGRMRQTVPEAQSEGRDLGGGVKD